MYEIIARQPPEMCCYEYALGKSFPDINFAHKFLLETGYKILDNNVALAPGFFVFYYSMTSRLMHVALVDHTSMPTSKFRDDENVYRHGIWEDPIPVITKLDKFYFAGYQLLSR